MATWAPFPRRIVIDRLRSQLPRAYTLGTAADLAAVESLRSVRPPSVYVVLAQETPEPRRSGHGPQGQIVHVHLGITMAVKNARDDRGAAAGDDLEAQLGAVREALIGWQPDLPGARPLQLTEGQVLDYDAHTLVWSDIYLTQHVIGNQIGRQP